MTHEQLGALAIKAGEGNLEAFAMLYRHFSESVFYLSLKMTKNAEDANDIVQETMIKLYNNLNKLYDPKAVTSFVDRIAYNATLDLLSKKSDIILDDDSGYLFENVPEEDNDFIPENSLNTKEAQEEVLAGVDELSPKLRAVIVMHYYQQLSISEIASTIDASESAVKTRLSRARQLLKELLDNNIIKGVAIMSTTISVLSRILQLDASAAHIPEFNAANWQQVCLSLRFPPPLRRGVKCPCVRQCRSC